MKKDIFRPVDFWKSAVITMQDNSFYELLRSVFGKIKTPFNKQQLLNDLENFLLRDDIQKTIASYIDENDAKIIAAVALLDEPTADQLESFFSCEFSKAQLQDIIVNMEERFILYRFTEDKIKNLFTNPYTSRFPTGSLAATKYLALNPVFKPVLHPFIANTSRLFPTVQPLKKQALQKQASKDEKLASEKQASGQIFNELILASLISFASQWEYFYTTAGVVRRRVIEEAKKIFPGIDFTYLLGALQALGLFYADENKLVPDKKQFNDFSQLSARVRSEYLAAALLVLGEKSTPCMGNQPDEILPPIFRTRIHDTVNLIHGFIDSLDSQACYPEKTIKRIIKILSSKMYIIVNADKMLESMEKTGLIINSNQGLKRADIMDQVNNDKPVIAIDCFSIMVYPEINFTDAITLASFLNIRETGLSGTQKTAFMPPVVCFEMNRDSAVCAFDSNISADEIINLLNRLSGNKTPQDSLIWNLKDWEKRHKEVSLKKGIILTLSEEHRYLTETKKLSSLITETLAPGLYLLGEDANDDAIDALRSAGIDIIAQRKNIQKPFMSATNYYTQPKASSALDPQVPAPDHKISAIPQSVLTGEFHAILKKMSLSDLERTELSARIDRRLVLCEAQLKDADIRYEKLEARLMDYAGKQNIAKQAISQKSPVEIIMLKSGDEEKIFGIPKALEKEGNELFLIIDAHRIPLAKINLLRRIKKSIFE
ncbi:MAG: helicase-associated domain-containing protein [Treponema sp.]|nr:helicase-associated domain-containing protein [Treponema sp.]